MTWNRKWAIVPIPLDPTSPSRSSCPFDPSPNPRTQIMSATGFDTASLLSRESIFARDPLHDIIDILAEDVQGISVNVRVGDERAEIH